MTGTASQSTVGRIVRLTTKRATPRFLAQLRTCYRRHMVKCLRQTQASRSLWNMNILQTRLPITQYSIQSTLTKKPLSSLRHGCYQSQGWRINMRTWLWQTCLVQGMKLTRIATSRIFKMMSWITCTLSSSTWVFISWVQILICCLRWRHTHLLCFSLVLYSTFSSWYLQS